MMATSDKKANPFIEGMPAAVTEKLGAVSRSQEQVLMQVSTDMADREAFEERWLVVTDQQLVFLQEEGVDGTIHVPLESVREARIEALVGGGRLEVDCVGGEPSRHLYYSNSLTPKFAEVAEGITRLARGETVELPTEVERSRCAKCNRILPEKGGICPACTKKLNTLKRLVSYMLVYPWRVVAMLLLLATEAALDLLPPLIQQYIIDDALTPILTATADAADAVRSEGLELLALLAGALLAVNGLVWLAWICRRWFVSWVGLRAVETLRLDLYKALQYLPLRFYDKRKVGSIISRVSTDSDLVETYLIYDIGYVLIHGLSIIGIISILLYKNWELTLYVLMPVPPIVIGSSLVWGRMEAHWQRWTTRWSRLSSHVNESIRGIRVVKAFSQERREGERFDERNFDLRDVSIAAERSWVVFFMVTNFFMSSGVFLVWYFGGRKIVGEEMRLGELIAFITYIWMLYQPLKWFGDFYGFMMRAYAGAERIFEVIDAKSEPFEDQGATPMPRIEGHISFDNVAFGYDVGKPVLKDVTLDVEPGEMIGLVGKSGAGKTTFVHMICRFYDATRGTLKVDGVDMTKIRIEDLRHQIGLVAQQSFLFNESIADNIGYGKPGASFDEILRASTAANAHEFIITKPDGYDMLVGEQGRKLSGGEMQRIAIARAILHDPRILILDEATSSLDTPTEQKIQEAISRLVKGRTTFAIAHRLSTLRAANRLVVIDAGKIVEVGSHEELMERRGFFYNLVQTQKETSATMAVSG